MAWIELHQAIWTHKKTLILAAELDLEEIYAAAHMAKLWTWAIDNAQDGNLSGLPARVIAYGAGWQKDPDVFVRALINAKWLDETDSGLFIHDWYDYAGKLIERREVENAYKKRKQALYGDMRLIKAVRNRDGDNCRYCGKKVKWDDRKSANGGTYDYLDPDGDSSVENVIVACRACLSKKSTGIQMQLLPPKTTIEEAGRFLVDIGQISGEKNLQLPYLTYINNNDDDNNNSAPAHEHESENTPPENGQANVYTVFENEIGHPLSPIEAEKIDDWLSDHQEFIVREALKRAVMAGKFTFRYIDTILMEWKKNNISTMKGIAEYDALFKAKGKNTKPKGREPTEDAQKKKALIKKLYLT